MKRILLLIVAALFFVGCDPITPQTHTDEIVYTKDSRTGLCFALAGGETIRVKGISIVPCEKVEHLIKGEKE